MRNCKKTIIQSTLGANPGMRLRAIAHLHPGRIRQRLESPMRIDVTGGCSRAQAAFTLVEVLIAFGLMVMVLTGVFFTYTLADRVAEFSSMSLAAQSYASQGLERARSFQWDTESVTNGDELPATNANVPVLMWPNPTNSTAYILAEGPQPADTMDVPQTGNVIYVTNYVYETTNMVDPPIRELKSVVFWTFPPSHKLCSNILVTLRSPDE